MLCSGLSGLDRRRTTGGHKFTETVERRLRCPLSRCAARSSDSLRPHQCSFQFLSCVLPEAERPISCTQRTAALSSQHAATAGLRGIMEHAATLGCRAEA